MLWPTWLDEARLMGKSKDKGNDTLAEHTRKVLERLRDQIKLRPELPDRLNDPRLWSRMYWACFLHDFGKAAKGFQQMLRKEPTDWEYRHEVLSLAFIDWLFPQGHVDRAWVIAAIAFHHRDKENIIGRYGGNFSKDDEPVWDAIESVLDKLVTYLDTQTLELLWRWVDQCAMDWAESLAFPMIEPPVLLPKEQALKTDLKESIFQALRTFCEWNRNASPSQKVSASLTRGLILTSDHAASGDSGPLPLLDFTTKRAFKPLQRKKLRDHQTALAVVPRGSAIMVAPTGSGKTEAAMLWAARQHQIRPASRIFYTLPYQASMNAMYARLAKDYYQINSKDLANSNKNQVITIQHSRALLKLYQDAMLIDEIEAKHAVNVAKRIRNRVNLCVYPIQIFSPYQMLKAAYCIKPYEKLLLDYTDALFIFDEIHAYDPSRLALIVSFLGWLRTWLGARFLVMTATLPSPAIKKLKATLNVSEENGNLITASNAEFERSRRHIVHLLEGRLVEQIDRYIRDDLSTGHSILICLNRVADAQDVYQTLQQQLGLKPDKQIVLLHSRFNGKDRRRKEDILLQAVGVKSKKRRPIVAVATQVVEVSLNVDFDTIYTDPAPLEALLQRFGRVNRGRKDAILCPVHIFRHPSGEGDKPYLPYADRMVIASLQVLEEYCGDNGVIDEQMVTKMLEEIYKDDILDQWMRDYEGREQGFVKNILSQMAPYETAPKDRWQTFVEMFDGVEVLPMDCVEQYYKAVDEEGYLAASRYLVNITKGQYGEFSGKGLIHKAKELEGGYADHLEIPYDPEKGLLIAEARRQYKARKLAEVAERTEYDDTM